MTTRHWMNISGARDLGNLNTHPNHPNTPTEPTTDDKGPYHPDEDEVTR